MSKKLNEQSAPFLSNKVLKILYSVVLVMVFFSVYSKIFDKKIDLNGDNASYYILGKSLADGNGYTNVFQKNSTPHTFYPIGYPLIVAATQKIFSDDFVTIKRVNGFLLLFSIILFFIIVLRISENIHLAFIVSLMLITNSILLRFSTIMMSEISFLFFSLLVLYFLIATDFSKAIYKNWQFLLLIIFLSYSYHIRSIALALIVGISTYLIYKKEWKHFLILIIGFGLLRLPWYLRGKSLGGGSHLKKVFAKNPYRPELGDAGVSDIFTRVLENFERYVTREIPSGVFNFANINYQEPVLMNEWFIGVLLLVPIIYGLFTIKKYMSLFIFYFISYFGILLLWPQVWFGTRFLLPIIPLLAFLFMSGIFNFINLIANKINLPKIGLAVFFILSLFFIKSNSTEGINKIALQAKRKQPTNFTNFFKIGTWVKNNTEENSVTISRKVQLFYLYSHKYGAKYKFTLNEEEQIEFLKSKEADYVVLEQLGFSSTARYLYPAIKKYPNKFKLIKHLKNPDTYLFKFEPDK